MEKRWVKRNPDVLLQLLQGDKEAEVKVVKKALVITPANGESIDEEDAALPDRLRSLDLVISLPLLQSPPSTPVTALLLALLEASRRSRHAWI
ncbi:hypothetical protein C8J56DRAFT_1050454 [Mycena floridula]|nr:hypothetical protein C8J56DRAFT_1050454 [Mycena floridula]